VSAPGTLTWYAHHEARLAWRDWLSMLTAGRRRRQRTVFIVLAMFVAFLHLMAYAMVRRFADIGPVLDKATLVALTGTALLGFTLMVSQGMESVTRAFYARSDLDLILSSPTRAQKIFAVRISAIALSITAMTVLLAAPFINTLAWLGGAHWLSAYGVAVAMGSGATAVAVALTIALFRIIGPKRTRLVAQIVAAVVGAAFVIGLQVGAIVSDGTLSRFVILESSAVVAAAPASNSLLWWPARAIVGDGFALSMVLLTSLVLLGVSIVWFSSRFAENATLAASVASMPARRQTRPHRFRPTTARRILRHKEWILLRRDPWLASQTLMQLLYLVPPAILLWHSFAGGAAAPVLLVPVLVMAAGQLAGGLAWLSISGEDAPDLVGTAPILANHVVRAKIEAVMTVIGVLFLPFVAALALALPLAAAVAAIAIAVSASSSIQIQLWFRTQAKRSHFRRRQTSSRAATFAEAFSSIAWAAAAALAAAGTWFALLPALTAIGVMATARLLRPPQ
jgi:ABC-2 type transport system permease protein